MKKILLSILFIFTIVTDQLSKYLIAKSFDMHETFTIIENILYLRYVLNPGIAFGMTPGSPIVMLIITLIIVIILGFFFLRGKLFPDSDFAQTAMVFLLGGAVGNLIDRIRMLEVVDFIEMGIGNYRWPVYNLADVYVTIGMFMLVITLLKSTESDKVLKDPEHINSPEENN